MSFVASVERFCCNERGRPGEMASMGYECLCRLPIRVFGAMAFLWAAIAWAAEEEPAWMARAPEIKFQKQASYVETSLQQGVAGMFGYSLAVKVTPEGRSEVSGGPLVRPMKGLEIGLERTWDRSAKARDTSLTLSNPGRLGAEFDYRADGRPQPPSAYLGHTGSLNYQLQGSRLRLNYHIDEQTVLSMRTRYNRAEQTVTMWLWLERRF
jgi:hypothetical protein